MGYLPDEDRPVLLRAAPAEQPGLWRALPLDGPLIRTVDYLVSRTEVDPNRIGCGGLSVGGCRAAHLAGLDPRIKAAGVVGWMSTYGDMLQSHLTSIGPMKINPGLYQSMDLPDVIALDCPGALMIINGTQDALFPLSNLHGVSRQRAAR